MRKPYLLPGWTKNSSWDRSGIELTTSRLRSYIIIFIVAKVSHALNHSAMEAIYRYIYTFDGDVGGRKRRRFVQGGRHNDDVIRAQYRVVFGGEHSTQVLAFSVVAWPALLLSTKHQVDVSSELSG